MTCVRRFTCDDLFTFNNVNLDYFTETVSPLMKSARIACLAPFQISTCTRALVIKTSLCRNALPCLFVLAMLLCHLLHSVIILADHKSQ